MADWGYGLLAGVVVLVHVTFVLFAGLGGLLVLRRPRLAWLHVPTVVWAAFVELTGRVCPLTPLENTFRQRAGLDGYSGDFVARYVFPLLYPDGLTRRSQIAIGLCVIGVNVAIYARLALRAGRRRLP